MELREIDALVAEKVFALEFVRANNITGWAVEGRAMELPRYSSDIAAAMEIPKKMREMGKDLDFAREMANILTVQGYFKIPGQMLWNLFYGLEAAPLIICLAALKAKGVEIEMGGVRE